MALVGQVSMTRIAPQGPAAPQQLGFLLLRGYSMIAFANALEVLRTANAVSQRELYRWTVAHAEPTTASASNGLQIADPDPADHLACCDMVLVCGGVQVREASTPAVHQLLRQCAAAGATMGSLCTGSFALASAGLLDGYKCAIHWDHFAVVREEFPKVLVTPNLFQIDRNRLTCSGGTAALHMMLHVVGQHHGEKTVNAISEQLLVDRVRTEDDRQRVPHPQRSGPGYQQWIEATDIMSANVEEPLPLQELSRFVGLSLRQLERIFHRYVDISPNQYYLNLRLRRAQELLLHSSMPILQISLACGFQSASHFCKSYRSLFGHAPRQERRRTASSPPFPMTAPLTVPIEAASEASLG